MRNDESSRNMNKSTTQTNNHNINSGEIAICLICVLLGVGFTLFIRYIFPDAVAKLGNYLINAGGALLGLVSVIISLNIKKATKRATISLAVGVFFAAFLLNVIIPYDQPSSETILPVPNATDNQENRYQPTSTQPPVQYAEDWKSSDNEVASPEMQAQSSESPQEYKPEQESQTQSQDKEENIQSPLVLTLPDESDKTERDVLTDIYAVTGIANFGEKLDITADSLPANEAYLESALRQSIDTDIHPGYSEVNADGYFTSFTRKANTLQKDIEDNGVSIEKQLNLIQLREEAYELYNTRGLRLLLAYDYAELARLQEREKDYENAYQSYIRAIEYGFLHIRSLSQADDDYYISVFNIAVWCAKIGDMDDIDDKSAIDAHYLSACLFQIASKNDLSEQFSNRLAKCYKYAADEYHKLHILTRETDRSQTVSYFNFAFRFYQQALEFSQYKKSAAENLVQLCEWAVKHISWYGPNKDMLDKDQYIQFLNEYTELSISVNPDQ